MLFQKIKSIISSCLSYIKEKIIQKLLKPILQNFLFKQCASLTEALKHRQSKNFEIIKKIIPEKITSKKD